MTALAAVQSNNNAASAASVSVTWPSTPKPNNLLIALVLVVGTTSPTITGWNVAATDPFNTSGQRVRLLYKNAGVGESSTVQADSSGATLMQIVISEWPGLFTSGMLDRFANDGSNSATNVNARSSGTAAATTLEDCLAIAGFGFGGTISGVSFTNGFSSSISTPTRLRQAERMSVPIGTSVETTASWTTARTAGGLVAYFRPLIVDRWGPIPI
jgi:hypothetical protein